MFHKPNTYLCNHKHADLKVSVCVWVARVECMCMCVCGHGGDGRACAYVCVSDVCVCQTCAECVCMDHTLCTTSLIIDSVVSTPVFYRGIYSVVVSA